MNKGDADRFRFSDRPGPGLPLELPDDVEHTLQCRHRHHLGLLFASLGQGRIAICSALLLVPAGIFTAWFPRWYPGHLARRGATS